MSARPNELTLSRNENVVAILTAHYTQVMKENYIQALTDAQRSHPNRIYYPEQNKYVVLIDASHS